MTAGPYSTWPNHCSMFDKIESDNQMTINLKGEDTLK